MLAVLGSGALEAVKLAGPANLTGSWSSTLPIRLRKLLPRVASFFTGPNDSLMERLQAACPGAHFVKAFNSVGSGLMISPKLAGGAPTMFYCGNDPAAKATVAGLLTKLGWEPADMGTAVATRALEPLCILWCIPGFLRDEWTHAFRLLRVNS